jgi:hypothetical protein
MLHARHQRPAGCIPYSFNILQFRQFLQVLLSVENKLQRWTLPLLEFNENKFKVWFLLILWHFSFRNALLIYLSQGSLLWYFHYFYLFPLLTSSWSISKRWIENQQVTNIVKLSFESCWLRFTVRLASHFQSLCKRWTFERIFFRQLFAFDGLKPLTSNSENFAISTVQAIAATRFIPHQVGQNFPPEWRVNAYAPLRPFLLQQRITLITQEGVEVLPRSPRRPPYANDYY